MRVPDAREDASASVGRRARWLTAAFRNAYDLGWAPEAMVANIGSVHVPRPH